MQVRLLFTLALSGALAACQGSDPSVLPQPDQGSVEQNRPPPAPPKSLADGTEVAGLAEVAPDLVKIDLATALSSGTLTVDANDPSVGPYNASLFDGDSTSLMRSNNVNPLIITLTLSEPIRLRAARVLSTYSPFDWLVEATPGGPRLLVRSAPGGAWSVIQLDQAQDTSVVRIEVLRLERDDFVHLNEIELYGS